MRRVYIVCITVLSVCAAATALGATTGAVSGVVRDSAGVPQIGAVVELLRPDMTVVASVYTDASGGYRFKPIVPGRYALKAMGTSFLPALRENVHIRTSTVVNLTLNTLYEVMQWLPSEPRAGKSSGDDWAWTLRSAANRPLLRWLEDGPLVVESDGSGKQPKLKARIIATGQAGTFGENGERFTASVEDTPSSSRELLARVDFDPNSDAGMESMLGFRQDLGYAGSVQSVAAVSVHPEIGGGEEQGLDEAAMRSWETMQLGDEFDGAVGASQVVAHIGGAAPHTIAASLPFVNVGWHEGDSAIRYRLASFEPNGIEQDASQAAALMPAVSMRNGSLVMEHGLHQEIGWERQTDATGMSVMVYAENIDNPVLEAMAHMVQGDPAMGPGVAEALLDPESGLMRATGPDYASAGVEASFERTLPRGNHIRLSYANGNALVIESGPQAQAVPLAELLAAAHPRRAQTYSISLSGTLDDSGTRWQASYRWQAEDTLTEVAPFAVDAAAPYLSLHVRQPICKPHEGVTGIDALFDANNLLAQGYRPYVLSDGSLLVFAEGQRAVRGGLAFTF